MKIVTFVQIENPIGMIIGGDFPNGLREFAAGFVVGLLRAGIVAIEIA